MACCFMLLFSDAEEKLFVLPSRGVREGVFESDAL
jgi:hypothetical protein